MGAAWRLEELKAQGHTDIDWVIIDAAPTDGLWPDGRTDMDQLGATYPELEWAMDLRDGAVVTDDLELSERQKEVLRI